MTDASTKVKNAGVITTLNALSQLGISKTAA